MTRARILFVDDQPAVLDGLRDLLRRDRQHWEVLFAASAHEALDVLGRGAVEIVVSDMRMPGMDGATLLARVQALQPAAIRIILSGHAERGAVTRAAAVAHQFLAKPCDGERLRATLRRALSLRSLLQDPQLKRIAGQLGVLPSVPRCYHELHALALDETAGIADIARVVARDPAMSAKTLQLVNSAYYGGARTFTSLQQAVAYLGIEALKALALTADIFTASAELRDAGFSIETLQRQAMEGALLAQQIVGRTSPDAVPAFAAGLLRDVGLLVLARARPDEVAAVMRRVREEGIDESTAELDLLGATHAQLGAYILGAWGLPMDVVAAVASHARGDATTPHGAVAVAVHLASALVEGRPIDDLVLGTPLPVADRARWELAAQELRQGHAP